VNLILHRRVRSDVDEIMIREIRGHHLLRTEQNRTTDGTDYTDEARNRISPSVEIRGHHLVSWSVVSFRQ
jgi:hypothetical protein